MFKLKKNLRKMLFLSLFIIFILFGLPQTVFGVFDEVDVNSNWRPMSELSGINSLRIRGEKILDKEYSFTPKFIKNQTKVTTGSDIIVSGIDDVWNRPSMPGLSKRFKFISKNKPYRGYVLYENVGKYLGEQVNLKMSFTSNSANLVDVGVDENTFLSIGLGGLGSANAEVTFEFFNNRNEPLEINGYWTFYRLNYYKIIKLNRSDFNNFYMLDIAKYKHIKTNNFLYLYVDDSKYTGDGDESYLTTTFNKKSKISYGVTTVQGQTGPVIRFTSNSLPAVPMFDIYGFGERVRMEDRTKVMKLFEFEQRVPFTNKENYQSKYEVKTKIDDSLLVNTSGVEIKNDLGQDVKNLFDVSLVNSELKIVAKATTLKTASFYDRVYTFIVNGKSTEKLTKQQVRANHVGTLTVKQNGVDVEYKSKSIETILEWSTEGEIALDLKRKSNRIDFDNVQIKEKVSGQYKVLDIRYPSNQTIHYSNAFVSNNNWEIIKNENNAKDMNSLSFVIEKNNSASKIKDFLTNQVYFEANETQEKATKETILVRLLGEVIIEREGEDKKTHYYKFVPEVKYWLDAYNAAKKERYKGLKGYLLTITSKEEHDFVFDNIAKEPGWLGGTRMLINGKTKINDEDSLSNNMSDYDHKASNAEAWYWVNGPEARKNFYSIRSYNRNLKPPERDKQGKIAGVYEGFRNPTNNNNNNNYYQPDNSHSGMGEYVLQFAQDKTKYWNDLYNEYTEKIGNKGYYVEFSEYGNQIEDELAPSTTTASAEGVVPKPITYSYQSSSLKKLKDNSQYQETYKIGTVVPSPQEPTFAHYQFAKVSNSSIVASSNKQEIIYTYHPIKYQLAYDSNGGTGSIPTQEFTIETTNLKIASQAGFSRKGYLQTRWRTKKGESATFYDFNQAVSFNELKGNTTLYADWKEHNAEVVFTFYLKDGAGRLVPLKDLAANQSVVTAKTKTYPVKTTVASILSDPSVKQTFNNYILQETFYQVGAGTESKTKPAELTVEGLKIKHVYQGTLALKVPPVISFKPTASALTPPKNISLTKQEKLEVINTQGAGGNWQVRAKLEKMMTRNNQKLLGEITYLPSANQTPIVFNETLKPIINNQTNQQIDTTIPLLETEKGLRLSLESGNLMGTYGEGIIKWELGDYPKVN
ncbi:hypothetical protein [Vagococcus sp.]|uniref:hypothetical protein n=1 Tax=Vagococcus sp. TaxID=1933889 RepID=UPI003F9BAE07